MSGAEGLPRKERPNERERGEMDRVSGGVRGVWRG